MPDGRAAIKFCGMMRAEDVQAATEAGATHLGVIFAGGPRLVSPGQAREILGPVPSDVRRVGVFGAAAPDEMARTADAAGLDVLQLHGDPDADAVGAARERSGREVWAVVRVAGSQLPADLGALFDAADAVVLDARVEGRLGGTGVRLDWAGVRDALAAVRAGRRGRLVLAGGLTPETVGEGVATLAPDVVDVSSGVERSPGVKDHARMRAFVAAVRAAEQQRDR